MAGAGKLTDLQVRRAQGPAVLHDGGGLRLRVAAGRKNCNGDEQPSAKSWVFRFQLAGTDSGGLVQRDYARGGPERVYEDRSLTCRDCSEEFIFSSGEQAFFSSKAASFQSKSSTRQMPASRFSKIR